MEVILFRGSGSQSTKAAINGLFGESEPHVSNEKSDIVGCRDRLVRLTKRTSNDENNLCMPTNYLLDILHRRYINSSYYFFVSF